MKVGFELQFQKLDNLTHESAGKYEGGAFDDKITTSFTGFLYNLEAYLKNNLSTEIESMESGAGAH